MSALARIGTSLVLTTLLAGCVPFPNFRYYAPAVSGVITKDGFPVENAQVRVSAQFAGEGKVAATGPNGRFAAKSIRTFLLTASLIGDPLYAYSVQVTVAGKIYEGYSEAGVGYAPEKLEVSCELSRPRRLGSKQVYCAPVPDGK